MNDPEFALELGRLTDPWDWERHCGACDYFETEKCPYGGKVTAETYYEDLGCKNFWD